MSRELAQGVPSGHPDVTKPIGDDAVHGGGVREHGGLGVLRENQLVLRAFPSQPRNPESQDVVRASSKV